MASLSTNPKKPLSEKLKALDKLSEAINAKAGKKIVGRIGADPEIMESLMIKFIPTPSQNVNEAIGGGFPRRRTTVIAGLPDSGKTSLVLESIAKAMKEDPDFVAGWLESENSLKKDYICNTFGIDPDRFFLIEHDRSDAGEGALDKVESVIATGAIDLMCINSLKCLVPKEEFQKSLKENVVGTQSRMNAKMVRKYTALVAENNTAFVIITHLTTQIGSMSHDPLIISGGNAIIYAASLILDLRKRAIQDTDPISKEEGIKINVTVKKNHCVPERNPYVKTNYYAIFNQGIEIYLEALENAIEQGILAKSGAFIKDVDSDGNIKEFNGKRLQWQGKEAFRNFMKDNPDYFNSILSRIKGEVTKMDDTEIEQAQVETEGDVEDVIKKASTSNKKTLKKK